MQYVKIDQESNAMTAQLEVRQELGFVYRLQFHECLELDDDSVLDQQIHSVSEFDLHVIILDREGVLRQDAQSSFPKLVGETSLVGAFQQPGT